MEIRQLVLLAMFVFSLTSTMGCGGQASTQQRWQETLRQKNLKTPEKLKTVARQMFDLADVHCRQQDGQHPVTMSINGGNPAGIVRTLEGKDADRVNAALKQFYLRPVISQLANFVHYTRNLHLGPVEVEILAPEIQGQQIADSSTAQYSLVLNPKDFDAFVEAAKLGTKEAVQQCEAIWTVRQDRWASKR